MTDSDDIKEFLKKFNIRNCEVEHQGWQVSEASLKIEYNDLIRLARLSNLEDSYKTWMFDIVEQDFLREKYPAVKLAWEKYQTVLKIANK